MTNLTADLWEQIEAFYEHGCVDAMDADPDNESWVRLLAKVREAKRQLSDAEKQIVDNLAETLPGGGEYVEGVGMVEVKRSAKGAKYDGEKLVPVLVAMAADERIVDPVTGEFEREAAAVVRVLAECSSILNPSHAWRTTPLKARGINLDDYRSVDGWTTTIRITPDHKSVA